MENQKKIVLNEQDREILKFWLFASTIWDLWTGNGILEYPIGIESLEDVKIDKLVP